MNNIKTSLDIKTFIDTLEGGTKLIGLEQNHINDLNVFPVPDGDTGSNMNATIANGFEALKNTNIDTFKKLAKVYSEGLLMNARGNSGVIFSQIMRGFTSSLVTIENELTPTDVVVCFVNAKDRAYASVAKPVEGTILTVIRLIADALVAHGEFETVNDVFALAYEEANKALLQTKDMLEALKRLGVVDSGGYGLMTFIRGMNGVIQDNLDEVISDVKATLDKTAENDKPDLTSFINPVDNGGFGYCSEIILKLGDQIDAESKPKLHFDQVKFETFLNKIGNSVVLAVVESIVKVHVHTLTPYKLLQEAQKYGEFVKVKIENMNNQFFSQANKQGINIKDLKDLEDRTELIVTAPSYKIAEFFKANYGINHIIVTEDDGNPSIQTILQKVIDTKAKNVVLVVDDNNIVLAAKQVAKLITKKVKMQIVVTNNAFETSLAIANFDQEIELKSSLKIVNGILKQAISGLVSQASKDVSYAKVNVTKGHYIGIIKKDIVVDHPDRVGCVFNLVNDLVTNIKLKDSDQYLMHIIYGKGISAEEALYIEKVVNERYGIPCNIEDGNQPTYDYIIGLESM